MSAPLKKHRGRIQAQGEGEDIENEQAYTQAEQHWKALFDSMTEALGFTHYAYMANAFADGTPIRDGNPIFTAYIPEVGRAVRIIQEPPADEPDFAAWLNDTEHPDGRPFTELVISLVLTETAQAQALGFIEQWIGGGELEGLDVGAP